MEQLFLNNILVDLGNQKIVRNIRASDIGDITKLKSSFSYTINVPRSSKNLVVLDMLSSFGNTSRKPFELIKCRYVIDGIPLISEGQAIIRESRDFFKINIIDGVANLSSLLGNKKLSELDLSELVHDVTDTNIEQSQLRTEGYVYALADFGRGFPVNSLDVEKSPPSIFIAYLWQKIFSEIGIEIVNESILLNDSSFTEEVLTPATGYKMLPLPALFDSDLSAFFYSKGDFLSLPNPIYENVFLETNFWSGIYSEFLGTEELRINVDSTYKFNLELNYSLRLGTKMSLIILINGFDLYTEVLTVAENQVFNDTYIVELQDNDIVKFLVLFESSQTSAPYIADYNAQLNLDLEIQPLEISTDVRDYMGETTQLDFIKDISSRYGLIMQPVPGYEKKIKIFTIKSVLTDFENSIDWSNKISSISTENYAHGYSKISNFKYNYNTALLEQNYNGSIEVDDYNAKNESIVYTSPFMIHTTRLENTLEIAEIEIFGEEYTENIEGTNYTFAEELKITPSVMKLNTYQSEIELITLKLFDEILGVVSDGILNLTYENCSMQYYIDNYYAEFEKLLNDYRKLTVNMNLSVVDVYNLDFSKLVFLRQTGRYYYVNSVRYSNNNQSKVELIEVK